MWKRSLLVFVNARQKLMATIAKGTRDKVMLKIDTKIRTRKYTVDELCVSKIDKEEEEEEDGEN